RSPPAVRDAAVVDVDPAAVAAEPVGTGDLPRHGFELVEGFPHARSGGVGGELAPNGVELGGPRGDGGDQYECREEESFHGTRHKRKKDGGTPSFLTWGSMVLFRCSDDVDVRRLEAFGALDEVELDVGAFREGAEALRLDGREVDEDVFAGLGGDEAKALRIVEPLDLTVAAHASDSPSVCTPGDIPLVAGIRVPIATGQSAK